MQRQAWEEEEHDKPTANFSTARTLCAPAPPQTHCKLLEQWAAWGLLGCHLGPSWALLGLAWARGRASSALAPRQTHGNLVVQGEEEDEEEGEEELSLGILVPPGSMEGLRAPQHHGKPGANWSNKGPLEPWRPS